MVFDSTGNIILKESAIVGIHRPFVNSEINKRLSPKEARAIYEKIENGTKVFLESVGVSAELINEMFRTPSDQLVFINQEDFSLKIGHTQAYFQEWLSLTPREYQDIAKINALRIASSNNNAIPSSISEGYAEYLLGKQAGVQMCGKGAVISHQRTELALK